MQQAYYTQCPMGYGLGTASGFQLKRLDPGYPVADIRHLAFRPFVPGTRVLAPTTLRYRINEGRAEVALLTPRALEYETERGAWGRPGGYFVHVILLDESEMEAIDSLPAALLDARSWRRADPEPTRGRPPGPWLAGWETEPGLDSPPDCRPGLGVEPRLVATMLSGAARAVREGRVPS
jgi:hypothetical protein